MVSRQATASIIARLQTVPIVLDSALLRPGRFERAKWWSTGPDYSGRLKVLKVMPVGKDPGQGCRSRSVARRTPWIHPAADLANLLSEAANPAAPAVSSPKWRWMRSNDAIERVDGWS